VLRGHEHDPYVEVPRGTRGDCAVISAGASYDRREPAASRYANGYNYVHLDFARGSGTVYLRRYEDRQGWIKDTGTTGDQTPGKWPFVLPKDLARGRGRAPGETRAAREGGTRAPAARPTPAIPPEAEHERPERPLTFFHRWPAPAPKVIGRQ